MIKVPKLKNKKSKVVNVKTKLTNPKLKKSSNFIMEGLVIILFLASIGVTLYKYTGGGTFLERGITDSVTIEQDESRVKFGESTSNPQNPLDIVSTKNNTFDISSFAQVGDEPTVSTDIDFVSDGVTQDGNSIGIIKVNDKTITNFIQEKDLASGTNGTRIQLNGSAALIDTYGRLKAPGLIQQSTIGSVFSGGFSGGCLDPSLILQGIGLYKGTTVTNIQYFDTNSDISSSGTGLVDNYIKTSLGNPPLQAWNIMTPDIFPNLGFQLNSTNILSFPINQLDDCAIVLPSPSSANDGDFINILCDDGVILQTLNNDNGTFIIRTLSFRSVDKKPFAKNSLLFNKNFQLSSTTTNATPDVFNGGAAVCLETLGLTTYSSDPLLSREDIRGIVQGKSGAKEVITDVMLLTGDSNIIFLIVCCFGEYNVQKDTSNNNLINCNESACGTTVKFTKIGGTNPQWAVEGVTYSATSFFLQKQGS